MTWVLVIGGSVVILGILYWMVCLLMSASIKIDSTQKPTATFNVIVSSDIRNRIRNIRIKTGAKSDEDVFIAAMTLYDSAIEHRDSGWTLEFVKGSKYKSVILPSHAYNILKQNDGD